MPNIGSAMKTQSIKIKSKNHTPLKAGHDTEIISGEIKDMMS